MSRWPVPRVLSTLIILLSAVSLFCAPSLAADKWDLMKGDASAGSVPVIFRNGSYLVALDEASVVLGLSVEEKGDTLVIRGASVSLQIFPGAAAAVSAGEIIPIANEVLRSQGHWWVDPDSAILLDYMLNQMIEIIRGLLVYPENMANNMSKTKGLVFSARILVELEKKGVERKKAYDIIQRCAMKVWEKDINFKDVLRDDNDFMKFVKPKEINRFFEVAYYTKHVNTIFKKVGI